MTEVPARERLMDAAVEAFAERGFHATTTRDISTRAGMSPAALYVHHASKEQLLYEISSAGHLNTRNMIAAAYASTADPVERLATIQFEFTRWHAVHSKRARVVQYEISALTPEHRKEVAGYRRDIERVYRDAIGEGVDKGVFEVSDVPGTALALISMAIDLVRWYQPGGPRTPEAVGNLYADLALRAVGAVHR
ncbi:TetR/AcrR family transcriptional regulator [Mumia sp. zg.B53]|uniref:TetR/AcrR family transcriptional regulator n=1 Tax=unclassified Mumia TaxID=2621872 RepID=UPI001C6F4B9D|nr:MULTISPECIES: TetR/AcrR family transcriptional regulator [unclassified Mumia]MBW9205710.1 TetR/AcrR family transcriptional regulator [Mumia sp. zg.B17]MBW9208289.1 TetR/AcrR family transcriptional regulator [Mumia sp. zg.B21]MBW9216246.1 TetR/AcrR family transcriptional regulator [Mumia sp. zg.B53]MDD9348756.1 TetR/AcrR family transcriptional regulator [Mumia sp.]